MAGGSDKKVTTPQVDHVMRGRLLRWYRSQSGMSLREFARLAGVNHSIVSRVETGSQHAPPRVLDAYREILDLEVRGSDVLPATIPMDLTIEVGIYLDELWLLRLVWRGRTEMHRIKPDLIIDAADWSEEQRFADNFGRTVEMSEPEIALPPLPHLNARPVLLSVPNGWVDAFAPFEEAWMVRPPRHLNALRFALAGGTRVDNCQLKLFLHSFNRTMVWFDDVLITRPAARMTIADLGPLGSGAWHRLSWGRLNNRDFGRQDYLYGLSRERERAARRAGWIQIESDLWESESGERKSLEDIPNLINEAP